MVVICDIDGTIANIGHRLHYIQNSPKNWDEFYEACDNDSPYMTIVKLVKSLNAVIYYVSGRRESIRGKTCKWLDDHRLPKGPLFMRKNEDYRADTIVKREILYKEILPILCNDKNRIFFVLDDRDTVVQMWREEGLTCLQVKKGDY